MEQKKSLKEGGGGDVTANLLVRADFAKGEDQEAAQGQGGSERRLSHCVRIDHMD